MEPIVRWEEAGESIGGENAVRRGRLIRLFPSTYVPASHTESMRWRAAQRYLKGMPAFKRQYRVDLYAEDEGVAFELDGAAFHGNQAQRERDVRRDATLAARGIQVVRFTYARLTSEPESCRADVLAILAARRRSLSLQMSEMSSRRHLKGQ